MLIWAYCKDPGGTAGILPVVAQLRQRGHDVHLFTEGVATKTCEEQGIAHTSVTSVHDVLDRQRPSIFLTSMCSKGGVGRDLVPHLRPKCVTVALQDFWGARLNTDWKDEQYRPHYIVVNDEVGESIVTRVWGDLSTGVIVSGYPALDRLHGKDFASLRQSVRNLLDLGDRKVILFPGQVRRSGQVLAEVVDALRQINEPIALMPRMHPRMKTDAPDQCAIWKATLKGSTVQVLDAPMTSDQALAVSDVVVGAFSTMLVDAAIMRKNVISHLNPMSGGASFQEETGGIFDEFPLVSLGCSLKSTDHDTLVRGLSLLLSQEGYLADHQEHVFKVDGRNTERLVDEIVRFL